MLVTNSWQANNILVGLETLVKCGFISPKFPLPTSSPDGKEATEVLEVQRGKSSPSIPFVRQKRRIFPKPDYSKPSQVEEALYKLKQYMITDFSPAFSNSLDPN